MFTGLVESVGTVQTRKAAGSGVCMQISAPFAGELSIGESIAVSGACLSVVSRTAESFRVDISPETIARTLLGTLDTGASVNLERAVLPTTRLGGHFVAGHVDCLGEVIDCKSVGEFRKLNVTFPGSYRGLIVEKGSIAIDGISLTINAIPSENEIEIMMIPYTLIATTAASWNIKTKVHLEFDLIAKHVARMVQVKTGSGTEMNSSHIGTIVGAFE